MSQPRDITNHVLFEVATEVANKGEHLLYGVIGFCAASHYDTI